MTLGGTMAVLVLAVLLATPVLGIVVLMILRRRD